KSATGGGGRQGRGRVAAGGLANWGWGERNPSARGRLSFVLPPTAPLWRPLLLTLFSKSVKISDLFSPILNWGGRGLFCYGDSIRCECCSWWAWCGSSAPAPHARRWFSSTTPTSFLPTPTSRTG